MSCFYIENTTLCIRREIAMKVTTSVLISLIQEYDWAREVSVSQESGLEIQKIRLADGTRDEHVLYICSDISEILTEARNSAFVLAVESPCFLPESEADLFEIVTDQKPLAVLYQLYSLLLRLQKWDHDLKENMLSSYHFYQLFSVGREIYPYPFCLIDHEFKIVGITKDMYPFSPSGERPQNNRISDSRAGELLNDSEFQRTSDIAGIYTYPSHQENVTRLCINISENGNYLGRILSDVRKDTPGIRALFGHLAGILSRAFLSYTDDVMVSRENDSLHRLLASLLTGDKSFHEETALVLGRYHWSEQDFYRIAVISLSDQQSIRMIRPYLSHLLEQKFPLSCVLAEGETLILISASQETEPAYRKKILETTSMWSLTIGISSRVAFSNLKIGYRQAVFALRQETASDAPGCRFFSSCHVEYIMDVLKREMPDEDFCHPGLRKLMEKDRKENTDDMKLIWELICSGFNVSKAAENCYVHRSTFIRRLHGISQITGVDFQHPLDPDTLFDLLISFRFLWHDAEENRFYGLK